MEPFPFPYRDWTDSWESDWTLAVVCEGGGEDTTPQPHGEPCTWGQFCADCDIWAEAEGVRDCCATDCDTGEIEISTSDGEVSCTCYH